MITLIVIPLTTLGVWLFRLGQHKTLFENSILSTSILSTAFFLFLTIGLYIGMKLKDNVGRITDRIKFAKFYEIPEGVGTGILDGGMEVGEGFAGAIFTVLLWIIAAFLFLLFIWLFNTIIISMIFIFAAMLYWIFFRALRLVFKNSKKCKGKLLISMIYGLIYTTLYNFWIYAIILSTHYFIK